MAIAMALALSGCSKVFGVGSGDGSRPPSSPEDLAQAVRIQTEFARLGMNTEGSECYARKIDEKLDGDLLVKAANIVANASTSEEVRSGVMSGGQNMQSAFVAARFGCPMVDS